MDLHLAEAPSEGHLGRRRQVLVAEQQQPMVQEGGVYRLEDGVVDVAGELQVLDLGARRRGRGGGSSSFVPGSGSWP